MTTFVFMIPQHHSLEEQPSLEGTREEAAPVEEGMTDDKKGNPRLMFIGHGV